MEQFLRKGLAHVCLRMLEEMRGRDRNSQDPSECPNHRRSISPSV